MLRAPDCSSARRYIDYATGGGFYTEAVRRAMKKARRARRRAKAGEVICFMGVPTERDSRNTRIL